MADKGPPLPKFGDWDVNDPASAESFTVIFNKARNEKKTGGSQSPSKNETTYNKRETATFVKPQSGWSLSEAVKGLTGFPFAVL
ncbi:RPM1-interacting protein 4 (RIN4) family protein [Artemisia annua]|uniref:RPM1-interacting protein 4 (RIN4) family protein n=1 Tax=Artemisia annua TaxID=35608 RepID=A0A2U1MTH7_ARTAN|nr:RPM1-interacting protein 4 (RIN4) family protein [Artemisia annua]